ncbi:flagellar hook protein FlgE [Rugamonas sp.]|uniref:flagellar hook protein FlgE n=1 Tax=Rugamonas sp. TaxID=1926287 RepID=UPI0025D4934D|nr:flagellar hook-basal body complex protein [Rugamonas sp.]
MSFDIALSGIQAIDQQLDQISNNIANAGTYGFKSTRDNFSALYANGAQPNGTTIGSTSQSMNVAGGLLNTGDGLNAAINGAGFFVVKDQTGTLNYTRVGIFTTSTDGFVTDATGRHVQGNVITPPSTVLGPVGDLTVPTGQIPAVASTKLTYVANLSADWTPPANTWVAPTPASPGVAAVDPDVSTYNFPKTSTLYDSLGVQHTLTQYFVKDATPGTLGGSVDVHYVVDGAEVGTPLTMTFDGNGQITNPVPATPAPALNITGLADGAADMTINFDYAGTTQFAGTTTVSTNQADGYASGNFNNILLSDDGSIVAKYSNGASQTIGKLSVATFANQGGLTAVDNTSWIATTASGAANLSNAGVGQAGTLTTKALEQSNVDITSELVGLMTSQRNYQANSKVIQTESTMLQSLMQALQ